MAGLNGTSHNGTSHNGTSHSGTSHNATLEPSIALLLGPAATAGAQPPPADDEQELLLLEAKLSATTAKVLATRARIAARDLQVRAALRAELDASRMALAELERQHEVTVAMIEEAARIEVARILADARRVAAEQRTRAAGHDE